MHQKRDRYSITHDGIPAWYCTAAVHKIKPWNFHLSIRPVMSGLVSAGLQLDIEILALPPDATVVN